MNQAQIIGGLITLVFIALCMLPGFLKRAKLRRVKSEWPKARTGMLECTKLLDDSSKFDRYMIKLQYTVDGKDYYRNTTWVEESLPAGSVFDAYYNPKDPNKVYLVKDIQDSWISFVIGGLFSVIAIVLYLAIAGWL